MKKVVTAFNCIFGCHLAGILGTGFTKGEWFDNLVKPTFNPPGAVFGPVWITLYTLMGISLYEIWQSKRTKQRTKALKAFFTQLAFNAAWTPIFFGWNNLPLSVLTILALDASLIWTIKEFYKIKKRAAYILIPYLLWVLFATVLNISIWFLNV